MHDPLFLQIKDSGQQLGGVGTKSVGAPQLTHCGSNTSNPKSDGQFNKEHSTPDVKH